MRAFQMARPKAHSSLPPIYIEEKVAKVRPIPLVPQR